MHTFFHFPPRSHRHPPSLLGSEFRFFLLNCLIGFSFGGITRISTMSRLLIVLSYFLWYFWKGNVIIIILRRSLIPFDVFFHRVNLVFWKFPFLRSLLYNFSMSAAQFHWLSIFAHTVLFLKCSTVGRLVDFLVGMGNDHHVVLWVFQLVSVV